MSQPQRTSADDPAMRTGTVVTATDPNERLHQLRIELERQQAELDQVSKQRDELQTDVADLETAVTDVKSALADYGSAVKDLEQRLHGLQYFYDQKSKMVAAAIGDKKEPIDVAIQHYDHETERLRHRLGELGDESAAAKAESDRADAVAAQKQAEYDAVKTYKASTENNLKELDTLRTAITQADDATDVASMYFLVLEFKYLVDRTQIFSQHHLAHELKQKLGDLEAAKEEARGRQASSERLQSEYDTHAATLAQRKADRRQHLLDAIHAKWPVQ